MVQKNVITYHALFSFEQNSANSTKTYIAYDRL